MSEQTDFEKIRIHVSPTRAICGRHGEVFRAKWPLGYLPYIGESLKVFLEKPSVVVKVQMIVNGDSPELVQAGTLLDQTQAVEFLLDQRPLCCQLEPNELFDMLQHVNNKHNVWDSSRCALCGKIGPGASYRRSPPNARDMAPAGIWVHVCLACVCGVSGVWGRSSN